MPLASGGIAIALVVAVVALAYGTQAPGLAVAEFAPSANRAVEPPPTTAPNAELGGGGAGSARRPTTTTTAPVTATTGADAGSAPTTQVGRGRPCYGEPARQSEDPMSPACLATIYEGDNGGATATGVTSTEIRVAIPALGPGPTAAANLAVEAVFAHLNSRFEFYGRRLVPVYVAGSPTSALAARTMGAEVAAQGVFGAVTGYAEWIVAQPPLALELGRQGVVTVVRGGSNSWSNRQLYDPLHPYVWSVYPSTEEVQANVGAFTCTSLAGQPAAYAGEPALRGQTRKVAVLALGKETVPSLSALTEQLTSCSGQAVERVTWTENAGTTALRTALSQLKSTGATTLVCICEGGASEAAIQQAHAAAFYPEWLLNPSYRYVGTDETVIQGVRTSSRVAPPILLSSGPKILPLQARPWYGALQQHLVATPGGQYSIVGVGEFVYPELLVLAAGIQGAGPQLTPETFAAGLMTMQFPNPGAGQAPYWQPSVGFGPGDHAFFSDFSVAWWSDTADALDGLVGYTQPKGSWCYLRQGTRFGPGTYPADATSQLFNANVPCR